MYGTRSTNGMIGSFKRTMGLCLQWLRRSYIKCGKINEGRQWTIHGSLQQQWTLGFCLSNIKVSKQILEGNRPAARKNNSKIIVLCKCFTRTDSVSANPLSEI